MYLLEIFKVALFSLKGNKLRSGLTMLGMIIGVAAVITLVSMGEGARYYISTQIEGLGTNLLIVFTGLEMKHPVESNLTYQDYLSIERKCPSVKSASPIIERVGEVKHGKKTKKYQVMGTTTSYQEIRKWYNSSGEFISKQDVQKRKKVCVIGEKVKEEFFGRNFSLPQKIKINGIRFNIIGVKEKKGAMMDVNFDEIIFIPVKTAERMYDTKYISIIFLEVKSSDLVDKAKREIKKVLKERHNMIEDFVILSQEEILSVFGNIMHILTILIAGIAGISLIVGGVGIMNIMLVSVAERTREIGLRKAVGAKKYDIFWQFLIESVSLSVIGGVMGIIFGSFASQSMAKIANWHAVVTLWSVSLAFFFSLLVGMFSGIYPALRAAKMDPIDCLRYE